MIETMNSPTAVGDFVPATNAETRRRVGLRVKAAITLADSNQRALAAALGMSLSTLSDKITGKVAFNTDELYAIARFLRVTIDFLLPPEADEPAA
jgi:transcriptional regulator with XRE-family HTH domain